MIIGSFLFKIFEVPIVLYDVAAGSNFMFWVNSKRNLEEPPDAPKHSDFSSYSMPGGWGMGWAGGRRGCWGRKAVVERWSLKFHKG